MRKGVGFPWSPGLLWAQAAASTTCQESSLGTWGFQIPTCVRGSSPDTGQVGPKCNELPIWSLLRCAQVPRGDRGHATTGRGVNAELVSLEIVGFFACDRNCECCRSVKCRT